MSTNFDTYGVTDCKFMGNCDKKEKALLDALLEEAKNYMNGFGWCGSIESIHFGQGVGGIFAVFLFKIKNISSPKDDLLWVIVGDLPPAYLVAQEGPENPNDALRTYIELMDEWVVAVRTGKSVKNLIPVNVPPSEHYADALDSRLKYLREEFLY